MICNSGFSDLAATAMPGNQPAAADRNHQRIELRHGGEHFERDGALPRDDMRIVIGVDHGEVLRLAMRARELGGLLQRLAGNDDLRAVTPGVLDLHHRRADRHHDGGGNAEPVRVIGHALRMIAGRHRDHAAQTFVRRQRQQPVERAALLEGRGELQVLEFEPEVAAADLAQRPALVAFGDDDGAGNGSGRGSDIIGRDGKTCFGSVLVRRGVLGGFRHFGASLGGNRISLFHSIRLLRIS